MANKIVFVPTFDDTNPANRKAAGLLEKMGIRATFFLTTQNLQREDLAELEYHEIGSHTDSHPRLTTLDPSLVGVELMKSKEILETLLGKSVVSFSHPYGNLNRSTKRAVRAAGYAIARGVSIQVPFSDIRDRYDVPLACSDLPLTDRSTAYHQLKNLVGGASSLRYFRLWNREVRANPYRAFEEISKLIAKDYADDGCPRTAVLLFHAGFIGEKNGWSGLEGGLSSLLTVGKSKTLGELTATKSAEQCASSETP